PPPPTTSTRGVPVGVRPGPAGIRSPDPAGIRSSDGVNEIVDRDRDQRLVLGRPARAELERDPSHRLLVGRLDDVDEVELAERRPLRLDRGAELLDLAVDLADPRGVVLDRLD